MQFYEEMLITLTCHLAKGKLSLVWPQRCRRVCPPDHGTVSYNSVTYTGDTTVVVRDGNNDDGCCRSYKTVTPHFLTL